MPGKKKIVKKVAGKVKSKAGKAVSAKTHRSWRGWLIGMILLFLAVGTGVTFIPEEKIPDAVNPVYSELLAARNSIIARVSPDSSRYEDTATVDLPGRVPVKLFFAPSPNIKKGLCDFIASAKSTVDVCIFDLDLNEIASELIRTKKRKVDVRVVVDEDHITNAAVEQLKRAGIKVVPDRRSAFMHNKFVIVDAKYIWTGSYNFTWNGTRKNDNNAVILESPRIAACYLTKFNEYFTGKFGLKAEQKTFGGGDILEEFAVRTAFSPADGVQKIILSELSVAKKSVKLMAFSFTEQKFADLLADLAKKGVSVECLFDYGQANSKYSQDSYLRGCGIQIKMSRNRSGKMHHKVILIDGETVITGSYNFSKNAEHSNDENILILKNRKIAEVYDKEFKRCWKGTKGY